MITVLLFPNYYLHLELVLNMYIYIKDDLAQAMVLLVAIYRYPDGLAFLRQDMLEDFFKAWNRTGRDI